MKYPTNITELEFGDWGGIFRGHGLDAASIAEWMSREYARDLSAPLEITEVHFIYKPRVKWCSKYGYGCDNEGDWHRQWFEVEPGEGMAFTTAYYVHDA